MEAEYSYPSVKGFVFRSLREFYHQSQEDTAKALGFANKSTISKIESNNKQLTNNAINLFYELIAGTNQINDEEEFSNLIKKFTKSVKLENKLTLEDNMQTKTQQSSQPFDNEKQDFDLTQFIKSLQAEKQDLIQRNFDMMRDNDELRHQIERISDSTNQKIEDLTNKFDRLKSTELKEMVEIQYYKIKADVIEDVIKKIEQDFSPDDSGSKDGLGDFLGKIDSSPTMSAFASSLSARAGDAVGVFLQKFLGNTQNIPPMPGQQSQQPYQNPFPMQNTQNYPPPEPDNVPENDYTGEMGDDVAGNRKRKKQ